VPLILVHVVESITLFGKQCKNNVHISQGHVIHHVTCRGVVELGQLGGFENGIISSA